MRGNIELTGVLKINKILTLTYMIMIELINDAKFHQEIECWGFFHLPKTCSSFLLTDSL